MKKNGLPCTITLSFPLFHDFLNHFLYDETENICDHDSITFDNSHEEFGESFLINEFGES